MSEVTVVSYENEVVVSPVVNDLELTAPGPQGPAGADGAPGPAGAAGGSVFEHVQLIAASTWTVPHNLGRRSQVTILDDSHIEVEADVDQSDINTVVVTFPTPQTGTVIVS